MSNLLFCDYCGNPFDFEVRVPSILHQCGCTFCKICLQDMIEQQYLTSCPNDNEQIVEKSAEECRKNQKILNFLNSDEAVPLLFGNFDSIPCPKHPHKLIEYFCKTCSNSVCVKCIYDDHNGHQLMQIEEMSNSLKQNVIDLRKMIDNTKRLIEENSKLIEQVKEELERLLENQLNNINEGFNELMRKLEEKKHEIIFEFEKQNITKNQTNYRKYKKEEQRFLSKQNLILSNAEELENIEKIFEELVQFIELSNDPQILQKISDITTFLHKSFTDLDIITKNQVTQKSEIYIDQNFKPLSLNVRKAMEIVKKFEMVWPSIDQRKNLKLFGMDLSTAPDKLGLYGPKSAMGSQRFGTRSNQDDDEDNDNGGIPEGVEENKRPSGAVGRNAATSQSAGNGVLPRNMMAAAGGGGSNAGSKKTLPPVNGGRGRGGPLNKVGNAARSLNRTSIGNGSTDDVGGNPGGSGSMAGNGGSGMVGKRNSNMESPMRAKINVANQSLIKAQDQSQEEPASDQEIIVDETHDQNKVYCFGDTNTILQFSVGTMQWWTIQFDNNSTYDGTLKYMASCATPDRKIFLTGGCFTTNAYPSSMCFELTTKLITKPVKKKNMLLKRYGHCMTFLNGNMYAIGGFSHKDLPNEVPVTLASVEKYSLLENQWSYVSTMNEARSFGACVTLENQFIYMLGGLHDFNVLQTIEKYDCISDNWVSVYFKLPVPLAKHGAVVVDNRSVLICGGMSSDFEPSKACHVLDLSTIKWSKKANMLTPKLVSSGLFYSSGYAFTFGGNSEGTCERYSVDKNKWQRIPSFAGKIDGENTLYTFTICMAK